jgi:hypothetical protein
MAGLKMDQMMGPAAIGIASAAANVIEKQAKEGGTGVQGQIMRQASLFGDLTIGTLAVLNEWQDWGFPVLGKGDASLASAGAGVALISRRAADWLGATMLQLPTGARYTSIGRGRPSRYRPSLRSPGAAVETSVLPRKRQFFSVT